MLNNLSFRLFDFKWLHQFVLSFRVLLNFSFFFLCSGVCNKHNATCIVQHCAHAICNKHFLLMPSCIQWLPLQLILLIHCRSVNYSINGYHRQHIVVMAEVVSVALELPRDEVVLRPSPGLLADSGENTSFELLWCYTK